MSRRVLLALLAVLLLPAPAAADDASLGRSGETVFPIGEPTVRMAAETVLLRISPERTDVNLTFTFANEGPAKQVLMGFPLKAQQESGWGHPELNNFTARVDGQAVPVTTEKASAGDYPGWMTWPVPFGAGQTRTVTNTYWGANSYWSNGEAMAGYILKTGAVWNGTIGSATVRAKLTGILPVDLLAVTPATYRWDGDEIVWTWTDFEPKQDITVRWNLRPWEFGGVSAMAELRQAYLAGDHARVRTGLKAALDAGSQEPLVAYLGVREGLLAPDGDVLGWHINPALKRWVQDRAGLPGMPPARPYVRVDDDVQVSLVDPDGDIADWGLKLSLQPDDAAAPVLEAPVDDTWTYYDERNRVIRLSKPPIDPMDTLYAKAWVVDARGHREETGWLAVVAPQKEETLALPPPEPAPVPAPPRRANPLGWYLLGAFVLGSAVLVLVRRLRRR